MPRPRSSRQATRRTTGSTEHDRIASLNARYMLGTGPFGDLNLDEERELRTLEFAHVRDMAHCVACHNSEPDGAWGPTDPEHPNGRCAREPGYCPAKT
jgi:hypothetical protein